jgi:hypothetical protein
VSGEFFLRSWSYHIVSEGRVTGMGRPRGDEPSGSGGREPPVTFNDGQLTAAGMGEGDGEWSGEAAGAVVVESRSRPEPPSPPVWAKDKWAGNDRYMGRQKAHMDPSFSYLNVWKLCSFLHRLA